jgi:hypothetical protein
MSRRDVVPTALGMATSYLCAYGLMSWLQWLTNL